MSAGRERGEAAGDVRVGERPHAQRLERLERRRGLDVADPHPRQVGDRGDAADDPLGGQRRRELRGDERRQDHRAEHPGDAEQPPGDGDRRLVAVAGRRHRDRSPPEAAEETPRRRRLELPGIPPPLGQPGQRPDDEEEHGQRSDGSEEGARAQRLHDDAQGRPLLGGHRHPEAAVVVGIGEVDDLLPGVRDAHRRERGVEPPRRDVVDHARQVGLHQLVAEVHPVGDGGEERDADPLPAAVHATHREGRCHPRADPQHRLRAARHRLRRRRPGREEERPRQQQPPQDAHQPASNPVSTPTTFTPIASTA